jgi:PAS domain S-box-containing protein
MSPSTSHPDVDPGWRTRVLEAVVSAYPDHVYLLDRDGRYLYASPAGPRAAGLAPADVIGRTWQELGWPAEIMEPIDAARERVAVTGEPLRGQTHFPTVDGIRHYDYILTRLEESGVVLCAARDVTEHVRTLASLRESRERYRAIVESQRDLIVRLDPQGRLTFANAAYCRTVGRREEELLGTHYELLVHPGDASAISAAGRALRIPPYRTWVENRMRTPDGWRWGAWESYAIRDPRGRTVEIQGVGRDITEQRRLEEALRGAERLASMGTVAAGLAHEINNPLAAILANAELALAALQERPEVTRASLEAIAAAAQRGGRIVKSVLQFARAERTEKSPEGINAIARAAADLASLDVARGGARLETDLAGDLPAALVNPTQIEQVLVNLVHNAIEAGGAGTRVVLRTRAVAGGVQITVEDDGPGMSGADRARAFDPFFTTRRGEGGTGLGLSVSHGIVADHGGSIDLAPREGGGTTVTIVLPRAAPAPAPSGA